MRILLVAILTFASGGWSAITYVRAASSATSVDAALEYLVAHDSNLRVWVLFTAADCEFTQDLVTRLNKLGLHPAVELKIVMMSPPDSEADREMLETAFGFYEPIEYDVDGRLVSLRVAGFPRFTIALTKPGSLLFVGGHDGLDLLDVLLKEGIWRSEEEASL